MVFTDPWIFADRLIFGLLVIINNWENNQQLGIFDDWDPGPAEKIMRGPTEFVMIGILSIFAD